jgi:hypothetical protein
MAISPKVLQENIIKAAEKFEVLIDNQLRQRVVSSGGSIRFSAPDSMEHSHFEILKPKYLEVGWRDVIWNNHYDQRDGSYTYIEFRL